MIPTLLTHWWYRKLSLWQLAVPPATTKLAWCRLLVFSVITFCALLTWLIFAMVALLPNEATLTVWDDIDWQATKWHTKCETWSQIMGCFVCILMAIIPSKHTIALSWRRGIGWHLGVQILIRAFSIKAIPFHIGTYWYENWLHSQCTKIEVHTVVLSLVHVHKIWWRHQMETFSALLAICAGNSPVPGEFPHKDQWRWALKFSLIWVWINGWVNIREAGDLRRNQAHYDAIVMFNPFGLVTPYGDTGLGQHRLR